MEVILIVGGSTALTAIGVVLTRKAFRGERFSKHHLVAGYFLSVVGTLYALVLGLIVVNAESKYERARATAVSEANACSDIWNFSRGLPPANKHAIRLSIMEYYKVVQNEPWQSISAGEKKEESEPEYNQVWQNILEYQPQTNRESSCYQSCLSSMQELSDARWYRLTLPQRGMAPIAWIVIITGGVLIVIFTFLFRFDSLKTQIILTTFVAGFIALNLLLVAIFDHPYEDHLGIKVGAFSFKPEILDDPDAAVQRKGINGERKSSDTLPLRK
jgi:hypothetical protein